MNHELIKDLESGKKGKSSGLKQQHLVSSHGFCRLESEQDSTSYSGPGPLVWLKSDNSWSWKGTGLASWGLVESHSLSTQSQSLPMWSSHSGSLGFFHRMVTLGLDLFHDHSGFQCEWFSQQGGRFGMFYDQALEVM